VAKTSGTKKPSAATIQMTIALGPAPAATAIHRRLKPVTT
jgi:hypothetical protein